MKVVYFAPDGFGYSSNQMTEGLHLLSCQGLVDFWCTKKMVHHGSKIECLGLISEEAAAEIVGSADIILFSSDGDMSFLDGVKGEVFRNPKYAHKIVFLDGHDSDYLLADPKKMLMYLKREHRYPAANSMIYPNVRSLTFGVYQFLFDDPTPPDGYDDRDIDICFIAFGGSNPARMACADVLRQLNGQNIGGRKCKVYVECDIDGQPVSINEYRHLMRRSKIGISIMGAGYDTLRYWETMAHGAVLASMDFKNSILIRDMPEPHRHAIYFDSWNRMAELCRLVVCDKSRWLRMRRATDDLIKCHSTKNRALQMLKMAQELI